MQIAHAALFTNNLERMKTFYCRKMGGVAGERYEEPENGFSSYFIRFDSGPELELMSRSGGLKETDRLIETTGYTHLAFAVSDKDEVDSLTESLKLAGSTAVSGPRVTGDGYYESCVLDPDGNRVEITCGKL